MYIRIAAKNPVGDHSVSGWESDRPAAHLDGVCCIEVDDVQDWAERGWPRLVAIGYVKRSIELAVEGASEEQYDAEGLVALRVWVVEGPTAEGQYDTDADIIIAESASDITKQALSLLREA